MSNTREFSNIRISPELPSQAEFSEMLDREALEDMPPGVIERFQEDKKGSRKLLTAEVGKKAIAGLLTAGVIVAGGVVVKEGLERQGEADKILLEEHLQDMQRHEQDKQEQDMQNLMNRGVTDEDAINRDLQE